jgi:hypothetical protein
VTCGGGDFFKGSFDSNHEGGTGGGGFVGFGGTSVCFAGGCGSSRYSVCCLPGGGGGGGGTFTRDAFDLAAGYAASGRAELLAHSSAGNQVATAAGAAAEDDAATAAGAAATAAGAAAAEDDAATAAVSVKAQAE